MILKTLHQTAWLTAGSVFLVLAVIGLLLPIIPQMPFFIAAVFCFVRCSPRFNAWLGRQHWFERFHNWAVQKHWFKHLKEHLPHPRHPKKHDPSDVD
jgi:uncharacterized membrane protein YbaN (DUF454 family)